MRVRRQPGLLWPVLKPRTFAKYWLPVLGWMVVIYSASGDRKSAQHSSRLIEPLVRWFFPHLTNETVWLIVLLVRKCAHLTEYAILALLLWWAWRASAAPGARAWSWQWAWKIWLVVVLYAAGDEFHQWFVPDRQASGWDVLIDASGAAAALLGLWALGCWRKWWVGGNAKPGARA